MDELVGKSEVTVTEDGKKTESAPANANQLHQEPGFEVTLDGKLRIIKINRAERKNAMTTTMYQGFVCLLKEAADDPNTSMVALTGAGNFFCSGNDLSNLTNFTGTVEEAATRGRNILQ